MHHLDQENVQRQHGVVRAGAAGQERVGRRVGQRLSHQQPHRRLRKRKQVYANYYY